MSRPAPFGAGARAVLGELALLARSGPFRVALVLSLLLHLALLVVPGGRGRDEQGAPRMRVRLVRVAAE